MKSTWRFTSLSMPQRGRVRVGSKPRVRVLLTRRMAIVRCVQDESRWVTMSPVPLLKWTERERESVCVNCHHVNENPLKLSESIMRIHAKSNANHVYIQTGTHWTRRDSFSRPFSCNLCIRSRRSEWWLVHTIIDIFRVWPIDWIDCISRSRTKQPQSHVASRKRARMYASNS